MCASLPIQELEVGEERLTIPGGTNREPPLHSIEEQCLVPLLTTCPSHRLPGTGRDKDLGLYAGSRHLRRFDHFGREHSVFDQKDI